MDAPSRASTASPVAGGGEMARAMGEVRWSDTPLGPVASWPAALRSCVVAVLIYRHPPEPLRIDMPADPPRLAGMRHAPRAWLDSAGIGPAIADAVVLATGEAATNAVEHAHDPAPAPSVTVSAAIEAGRVEVTVRDAGHWRPPEADPGDRGRGLDIIRAVMDDVELVRDPEGTTVRMRVELA